jgi:hypothetical protein
MHSRELNRSEQLKDIGLVSDSLRIVCLALILASAAILFRIVCTL